MFGLFGLPGHEAENEGVGTRSRLNTFGAPKANRLVVWWE